MAYIQKIVPADIPMLQMPKGYDVISYRIEHVRTAKNPQHYSEFEKEIIKIGGYYIPDKYLEKYICGHRIEPFIRIYRTIAPHSEVEKYLKSGGKPLNLFKNKDIDQAKEEVCYTSLDISNSLTFKNIEIDLYFPLDDEEEKEHQKEQKEKESAYKREFELTLAPKLKNISDTSNKFMAKCIGIDIFFDDVKKYLEDPADFHREQIIQRALMLYHIFELCEGLDPRLPDGFAEKTSSLSKNEILEILSVVEILKWQVGLVKDFDDRVWNSNFYTKDVLWNSTGKPLFGNDFVYILKEIAAREGKKRLVSDEEFPISPDCDLLNSNFSNLLQVNPHKHDYYCADMSDDLNYDPLFYWSGCFSDCFSDGKSIKACVTGKEQKVRKRGIFDLSINIDKLTSEEYWKLFTTHLNFLKDVLLKNLEQYPSFLKERLVNVNTYPGNIFRIDLISEEKIEDFENFVESMLNENGPESMDDVELAYPIHFDILYLAEYSDLIILADQLEKQSLSVYEALNKIQDFDPDDTIASRFLAEFAYKEINKEVLSDLWNKFLGNKIYEESEKEEDPAEAMAVKAFKIYRRTLKQLVKMLGLASSVDPTITMFDKQRRLPGLAVIVKEYLLDKLLQYSRIPLNKSFVRDANEKDMKILEYIPLQNEDARTIRNKFSHGVDISEQELIQFISFCSKITDVAEETTKNIEKESRKDREGKQEQ